ncbi:unnamed protein product [Brassica oleracea]
MSKNGDGDGDGICDPATPDKAAPLGLSSLLDKTPMEDGDCVTGKDEDSVPQETNQSSGVISPRGSPKNSYSAVVKEGSSSSLVEEAVFVVNDGIAEVAIPEEILEDVNPLWKCFVVGYFMNDAPHIGSIHATVNRIWAAQGKRSRIDVQFIGKTTCCFRLRMRNHASVGGPYGCSWLSLLKQGIEVIARASAKFIKLHPNTEKCIRMDVARVLVEVDLTKPLPSKISFKGRDGSNGMVSVSYPWLPPRCISFSKWGHAGKDCQVKKAFDEQKQLVVHGENSVNATAVTGEESGNDAVEVENFPTKEGMATASTEIVSKLMEELESISGKENLYGVSEVGTHAGTSQSKRDLSGQGLVMAEKSMVLTSFTGAGGCLSPNGFSILQDIREEREIDDDDAVQVVTDQLE